MTLILKATYLEMLDVSFDGGVSSLSFLQFSSSKGCIDILSLFSY
jgi:hypothetical protein